MHRISPFSALLAGALFLGGAAAGAELHRVRAGEKIAPVLARAAPGDEVRLAAGEYRENLTIDVAVHLRGEEGAHIRGGYEGVVVHVLASGTVIEGLHLSEAGTSLIDDMAVVLVEADDVTIRGNTIDEPLHGVYVKGGNRAVIAGNRIEGRRDLIQEDRGNGIHLWNSIDNRIEGNEIANVRDGIYFSFAHQTRITANHIQHARYGLHYMYSNHNTFEHNVFTDNVAGAALMYSSDIVFTGNVFARCRGFRAYGILYQSMENTRAEENLILDNSRGIFLNNSHGNVIRHNDVVANDLALVLNAGGGENLITANNFIDNLSELLLDVGEVEVSWIEEGTGNYWSRYRGYDLDGDGVGEVAHTIQNVFQVLENNTPEARFYLLSPAAEILELAETTFPILELGRARDEAPRQLPVANAGVPWSRVPRGTGTASPAAAGAYLLVSALPLLFLFRGGLPRRG